jgi:hypothetical protein
MRADGQKIKDFGRLSTKTIYFGHQSVGYNIMDGVRRIIAQSPDIKLEIKESRDLADYSSPVFGHSRIGANSDPVAKIDDFKNVIRSGLGDKVDIAFFKFCYVDITEDSDVDKIFSAYTSTLDALKQEYPHVKFVHVSVPLNVSSRNIKARIKRLLGLSVWADADNIKREQFNRLLREKYAKEGTLYDLAAIESTYPDGRRNSFSKGGNVFYGLIPEYASDHGHLNEYGSKVVAERLLELLSNLE